MLSIDIFFYFCIIPTGRNDLSGGAHTPRLGTKKLMTKAATSPYRKFSGVEEDDRLLLIYRTAARVIHAKGYDATSLNEIADAVGITKGGLYHYIDGKKSLLFKIMSYALDRLEAKVSRPVAALADAEEQLRALLAWHAELIIDGGIELTILLDESAGLTTEDLHRITERRMQYYKFLRAILQRLQDEGKLHDLDVTIATHGVIGQLQWLARWYVPGGRLSRDEVIAGFVQTVLTGLLRSPMQKITSGGKARLPLATSTPRRRKYRP